MLNIGKRFFTYEIPVWIYVVTSLTVSVAWEGIKAL